MAVKLEIVNTFANTMHLLPFDCYRSDIKVIPANYDEKGADVTKEWYAYYRFYDANYKDTHPKGKLVIIKGMNKFKDLATRRKTTKALIESERKDLEAGFNPIFKGYPYHAKDGNINEKMPFTSALTFADSKIKVAPETRIQETNLYLKYIIKAAQKMGIANLPVESITRRHIREICEAVSVKQDKTHSADKYNRCRKVLSYYYRELLEYEVVQADIPKSLQKQKAGIKKVQVSISAEKQRELSEYLRDNYRDFYLYLQCFYNIAPRSSEMLRLKVQDVDLINQRVKFVVKKGKAYSEKYRVITDVAVPYWREIIGNAPKGYYVFGEGLKPSETPIKAYQIHKRWWRLVTKNERFKDIGLTFYKLKHLRLTEMTDTQGTKQAANLAAESEKMVKAHYDLNTDRGNEDLRKSGKTF